MALTNAEKQAAWRGRRDQHIKSLEKQVKQLKAEIEKMKVAPEDAQGRQNAAAGIRRNDWEILVDDDGEGYLSAYEEPHGLYVRQIDGACFFWHVNKDQDDGKDAVDVAEGETPTVIAAMAAAEAAVRGLGKKVAKKC